MMGEFRKGSEFIQARQIDRSNIYDIAKWCGGHANVIQVDIDLTIPTLKGNMRAWIGDWIVKDVGGKFFTCRQNVFDNTYEPI